MLQAQIEIILIASVVAASCALVGSFLVLRRMALLSDAISHAILFGIVLMFFVVESTTSPLLVIAATLTGVLTVLLVEALTRTQLVKEDAAIGLVFPLLFSLGVILITRYAANVHLDVDAVLLGEIAFAPFSRFVVFGLDLGPQALWLALGVGALNLIFILLFWKELKLATFDAGLAAALGFSPALIHYALMTLVSVTAVSSFEAAGTVLVVALMIAPPAAAYLLTDRLPVMLGLSVGIGVLSAVTGFALARVLDASIAGSMATMTGVAFLLALLFAPQRGLVRKWTRGRSQRRQFAGEMLLVHLSQHEADPALAAEATIEHMARHMRWPEGFGQDVVKHLAREGFVSRVNGSLALTPLGREVAQSVMLR
ncbi:MAG: metal ABC transporter permease [Anaerolineae bacterium]|jgi:manganese/zinc/iron transport system permease protein|nr:metal ABC transporter permease [Anaerolineae bacterium]